MKRWTMTPVYFSLMVANAYSFGVDVCFNPPMTTLIIQNCINTEESCRTSNLLPIEEVSCRAKALVDGLSGLSGSNTIIGGRSLLHSDSTYLIAQLLGFTPWQAYQMMIYDEATDQSDYVPFAQNGTQMLSDDDIAFCRDHWGLTMPNQCQIITQVMNGIYKFNYGTGGMLLHLHARYSADGNPPPPVSYPTDYLSPQNKPYEVLLSNLHDWVFDERYGACAAGITHANPLPDTDADCEYSQYVLNSPMYFFAPGYSPKPIPFASILGSLIINQSTTSTMANDDSFRDYIMPHAVAFAKLGIFLHSLGDRYSHHLCTDNSYFYQQADGNYTSIYSNQLCAQGSHFLWHTWEQGTDQSDANLAVQYQTMQPALEAIYDQIVAYRVHLGLPVNPVDKKTLISELITTLGVTDPTTRLNKMVDLMEAYGVLTLPGHGAVANLSIDQWLALAGAPVL